MKEIIAKIIEVVKPPIKVLLPAVWLFSAIMIFLPEAMLVKLNLFEWQNVNGFYLGLTFLITTCFILIYILSSLLTFIGSLWNKATQNWRMMKKIQNLNSFEQQIIYEMYNSPNYTLHLDLNQPMIKGLLSRNYIYMGSMQSVEIGLDNSMYTYFTLQPPVYKALDYYEPKFKNGIGKIQKKLDSSKNVQEQEKYQKELDEFRMIYNRIYKRR